MSAVDDAIAKAGTQGNLAKALGVKQPVIAHWKRRGWMPAARAAQIESLYGIPATSLLRPQLREIFEQ